MGAYTKMKLDVVQPLTRSKNENVDKILRTVSFKTLFFLAQITFHSKHFITKQEPLIDTHSLLEHNY